jgi:hypothetical protein
MTPPVQILLSVVPLACYLYLVGIWQAGRHPRVVGGGLDVTLLALGVGGLVLFGPFGQLLAAMLFGRPDVVHWLILVLIGLLVVSWLARRASRRLVVYHVTAEDLDAALRQVDVVGPESFVPTLDGFEDRSRTCHLRLEYSPRWKTAVVEASGRDPSALIQALERPLRIRLGATPAPRSEGALIFFGLSTLTMLVPLTGYLLTQPRARAALRALFQHLHGG